MYYFHQRDERWKDRPLGTSKLTIGEAGCLLCCVTTVANFYSINVWPNELNALLNKVNGYQDENLLLWYVVQRAIPLRLEDYGTCPFVAAPMDTINRHLGEGRKVIVKIDFDKDKVGVQEHWVVLLDKDYHYYDPWDNKIKMMTNPAVDILAWGVYIFKE